MRIIFFFRRVRKLTVFLFSFFYKFQQFHLSFFSEKNAFACLIRDPYIIRRKRLRTSCVLQMYLCSHIRGYFWLIIFCQSRLGGNKHFYLMENGKREYIQKFKIFQIQNFFWLQTTIKCRGTQTNKLFLCKTLWNKIKSSIESRKTGATDCILPSIRGTQRH